MPSRCSGAKLRQQMANAKMTTSKLIQKSGVSESTIRRIFADKAFKTNDTTLQLLADALGCSPFDLLREEVINDTVRVEVDLAVSEIVAEAVMDAVTVVTDSVAPEATEEEVAQAVPEIQVVTPPALDIPSYIEYIKESTAAQVKSLEKSRNAWRMTSGVLFLMILALIGYFLWEILHPNSNLTTLFEKIYGNNLSAMIISLLL